MIHVLIERHIADAVIANYEDISRRSVQTAYGVHGFVSAESFVNTSDVHHRYLLTKWRSQKDWNRWHQSQERLELMNQILPLLEHPEKITILEN